MKVMCYECNLFSLTCDGKILYKTEEGKKECTSRERDDNHTVSPLQVAGFISLFRAKVKYGIPHLWAFAEAIVQTSDDAFKQADVKLINKYQNRPARIED